MHALSFGRLQEQDASAPAEEARGPKSDGRQLPVKGEDISDKDVAKLIVVKQSRARRGEAAPEPHSDEASVISDGLQYYETELHVGSYFSLIISHSCKAPNTREILRPLPRWA